MRDSRCLQILSWVTSVWIVCKSCRNHGERGLPDVDVAWVASTLVLGQTDSLTITSANGVVDSVSYDRFSWGTFNGVSLNLSPVATDETDNDTTHDFGVQGRLYMATVIWEPHCQ